MAGILVTLILLVQGIPVQQGGTVTGVLRDSQGMPVPGVRIAAVARTDNLEDAANGSTMAGLAETDSEGRFTLESIPPGRYIIAAGRLDLQTYYPGTQTMSDASVVAIAAGSTVSGINFVLNNTSFGRAQRGFGVGAVNATIPLRVTVANGSKFPISADGKFTAVRLESSNANTITIPLDGNAFTVPGPVAGDFRVTVENLPDTYVVKSITYGATNITQSAFRLTPANFPAMSAPAILSFQQGGLQTSVQLPTTQADLQAYLAGLLAARGLIPTGTPVPATFTYSVGATTAASFTPPSTISITLGAVTTPPTGGVRVSGQTGSTARRLVYLSGKPGIQFSDGTFEFRGVPPGRHLIATVNNPATPMAAVIVVGDRDVEHVELKETLLLPPDVRTPKDPLPPGDYVPGSTVPLARVTGTVLEEATKTPISEGQVIVRSGESSRTAPIDADGHFETFYLLPGTYELRLQVFGHSTTGPTIVIEDKDLTLELTTRRLY